MRRVLLWAFVLGFPVMLRATVLVPIEFRELVKASDVIVHGRVSDVHGEWMADRRSVDTLVTIDATDYLKGGSGATVTVHVPGGQLGRYRTVFVGAPEFRAGDDVVLFLRANRIIGLSQGAFRVVPDPQTGRPIVVSPLVMSPIPGAAELVVRGDQRRKSVALDQFREIVRQVLAGPAR